MFLDIHQFRLFSPTIVWNNQGSISDRGKGLVSSPQSPDRLLHPPPPSTSYTVSTGGSFPGSKAAGREADRSLPSSAEIKNGGAIPPLSHMSSWRGA
jgi:hypothetical protein